LSKLKYYNVQKTKQENDRVHKKYTYIHNVGKISLCHVRCN